MGHSNVTKVINTYAHLHHLPWRVLIFMANTAKDDDAAPWYGMGHEAIATICLGLPMPEGDTEEATRTRASSLRAVGRAITILYREGAITTLRHSKKRYQVRYLLWLNEPAPDAQRPVEKPRKKPNHRTLSVLRSPATTGRSASDHRTLSVGPPDAERLTEELRGDQEERSSSKANLDQHEPWNAPPLPPGYDPWAEEQATPNGHRQATP